jgi:hypothetical protein
MHDRGACRAVDQVRQGGDKITTDEYVVRPVTGHGDADHRLTLVAERAKATGAANVGTGPLLHGLVADGCEHLLIGLAAEPDGAAGKALRAAGADPKTARRAVATALAGYAHLRASAATPAGATGILTAVRAELQPLIQRIEGLESRLN